MGLRIELAANGPREEVDENLRPVDRQAVLQIGTELVPRVKQALACLLDWLCAQRARASESSLGLADAIESAGMRTISRRS